MTSTTRAQSTADPLPAIQALGVVPVIVIDDAADAVPFATALSDAGLPCAEITFRTGAAADAIRRITDALPDMLVGAGTVLTPHQVQEARDAGARFVVSPGFNPRVTDACAAAGLPVYPGVSTPTEIELALERGLRVLKFFPAEVLGGLPYLRAIAAPYGDVEFIPTGGVDLSNLGDYLAFDRVVACGGTWIASAAAIREKRFEHVRQEAARAVACVQNVRRGVVA